MAQWINFLQLLVVIISSYMHWLLVVNLGHAHSDTTDIILCCHAFIFQLHNCTLLGHIILQLGCFYMT